MSVKQDIFRKILMSLSKIWVEGVQGNPKFNETLLYFYPDEIHSETVNLAGGRLVVKFYYEHVPHTELEEPREIRIDRIK